MRRLRAALLLALFATASLCAQGKHASKSNNTKMDALEQDATPTLSEADRSLACPVGATPDKLPDGVFKAGGEIQLPKFLKLPYVPIPDQSRLLIYDTHPKSFQGISRIKVIVGADGTPKSTCVQKPVGYGIDGEAVRAVQESRFAPATNPDGTPVSAAIVVEVSFAINPH
jgi:hypothetical protein